MDRLNHTLKLRRADQAGRSAPLIVARAAAFPTRKPPQMRVLIVTCAQCTGN